MLRIETIQSDYHCVLCSFNFSQTHLPGASQGTMMAVERILVETRLRRSVVLSPCSDEETAQKHLCPQSWGGMFACVAAQMSPGKMRQLKGKPKKETSRDKKERKQAMQEARRQITTVVLPTLAVVVLLIVVFVYVATRPASAE
ncbi:hypothetical protein MG293_019624 [Ovis ammon polii]|uniref:Single-pass membrane and coiled-coil domain-containing protein 4 n=1 Tax=Ovis ammon polii TaxID=230172 RepID=A0AAD4Y040_OVIAM|nr:hypothetical protein MG293_019624 [Ovis ammon polii]